MCKMLRHYWYFCMSASRLDGGEALGKRYGHLFASIKWEGLAIY